MYKNPFYRANRIWTSGPAFARSARSFQILTNACAFYCEKKSTVLKTVDSEKLFIGQTGFEPATSTSRTSRATSCAIARKKNCPKLFSRRMRPQRPELENRRTVKKNCEDLEQFFRFYLQATRYQLRKFSKKT